MNLINITPPKYRLLLLMLIGFCAAWAIFKPTLKIALSKNIVDNPNARKLQKTPVPILGGVVVFFGIAVGLMFFKTMFYQTALLPVLAAMVAMLYIGTIDDISDIRPTMRLAVEIATATLLIYGSRSCIMEFYGLWGITELPLIIAIPLTILTIVGLINAINMIDGVDGLLSGFGIFICGCFGLLCFLAHDYSNAALAAVSIGALMTFFLHNVFGMKSKMFLGDGGSMLLGVMISWMVITILGGHFQLDQYQPDMDFNLIALTLAVVGIPVADTLRVMFTRILHGESPFHADNNHLHHLLVRNGLSHLSTTLCIIGAGVLLVAVALGSWALGASADWQLYSVMAVMALLDGGGAHMLRLAISRKSTLDDAVTTIEQKPHHERAGFWLKIQTLVDGKSDN